MRASGITPPQAIKPNVMIHLLRTGTRYGPMNKTASTRWAKANQSVPYARNGYCEFVSESAWCTRAIQGSRWVASAIRRTGGVSRIDNTQCSSVCNGKAVTPLRNKPAIKKDKPESNRAERVMRQGLNFLSEGLSVSRWTAHILVTD